MADQREGFGVGELADMKRIARQPSGHGAIGCGEVETAAAAQDAAQLSQEPVRIVQVLDGFERYDRVERRIIERQVARIALHEVGAGG